ncbi:hypothetical protein GF314_16350 [bacterium]|nr:hypothetical protein [bacterium]
MHRILPFIALVAVLASLAVAQDQRPPRPMLDYQTRTPWLPETPGVTSGAMGGFLNPAAWTTLDRLRPELAIWFDDQDEREGWLDNWGLATSGWLGFGMNSQTFVREDGSTFRVTDWQTGVSGGDRTGRLGLGYRWSTDDDELAGREQALVLGGLLRPGSRLSLGLAHTLSVESTAHQTTADLGLRPLGSDRLTLFADYTLDDGRKLDEGYWGAGLTVQPVHGLHLGATVRDDPWSDDLVWLVNVGLTVTDLGLHVLPQLADEDAYERTSVAIRFNPPGRNLVDRVTAPWEAPPRRYAPLDLENRYLTYQKYQLFDQKRVAWLDLAAYLDAIEADGSLSGVVVDLRDFVARPSLAWELRGRLSRLQERGLEVVVLVNRVDMIRYYLASVADRIVIDPEGDLVLQGVASGRTYFADMLEKMGLGYQELRYFRYKSAAETGSRMTMSEGQREQSQRVVDVIYEEVREVVGRDRQLTDDEFDGLVDDAVGLVPRQALERGLVDAIGRRHDVVDWLRRERGGAVIAGPDPRRRPGAYPETRWGEPPRIAVVYAVGGCAMDSGIEGRATSRHLGRLASDPDVAAVVLRADSPGGDPLPSDLVAEGLRRCREAGKPVIVSQGDVAASGGYWISMNGDEILTTPLTLTGSIGVIAAWVHDDNGGEKLGLNYDGVQRGAHADLLRQIRVPGLGVAVPHRALDEQELDLVHDYIMEAYDGFVERVAEGRDLDEDKVREVAQGRVWMGGDAIERGLCDDFGGLTGAIELARARAGIAADEEAVITEYPPRPLIDLRGLLGGGLPAWPFGLPLAPLARLTGAGGDEAAPAWATFDGASPASGPAPSLDYARWFLDTVSEDMGRPRVVLPPENLPHGWALPE